MSELERKKKEVPVIEKTDTSTTNRQSMPGNLPPVIQADVKDIWTHFANGTMTVDIFNKFIQKVSDKFPTHQSSSSNNNNKSEHKDPEINVTELISQNQLVTAFNDIKARTPKTKLCVSFYPKFFIIVSQTKHDQDAMKTVIYYTDIVQIICVPEKNDDILLYAQLNKKIALNFKKQKIGMFLIIFINRNFF